MFIKGKMLVTVMITAFCVFSITHATAVIELTTPPNLYYTLVDPVVEWEFLFKTSLTLIEAEIVDVKNRAVASILSEIVKYEAGRVVLSWMVSNKEFETISDGILYLRIVTKDEKGHIHVFPEPAPFSPHGFRLQQFEISDTNIRFTNPYRGLVTVRLGYSANQENALCQSVVNWVFLDKGFHEMQWTYSAFQKTFTLSELPNLIVNTSCYPLPSGCFALFRNVKADSIQYDLTLNEKDLLLLRDANRYRYNFSRGDFELDVRTKVIATDDASDYQLHFTVSAEQAPFGWLETPGLIHEVKVFFNDLLVFRSRANNFPYENVITLKNPGPGDHRIVINAWDTSYRFGYWSGTLNLTKPE